MLLTREPGVPISLAKYPCCCLDYKKTCCAGEVGDALPYRRGIVEGPEVGVYFAAQVTSFSNAANIEAHLIVAAWSCMER